MQHSAHNHASKVLLISKLGVSAVGGKENCSFKLVDVTTMLWVSYMHPSSVSSLTVLRCSHPRAHSRFPDVCIPCHVVSQQGLRDTTKHICTNPHPAHRSKPLPAAWPAGRQASQEFQAWNSLDGSSWLCSANRLGFAGRSCYLFNSDVTIVMRQ